MLLFCFIFLMFVHPKRDPPLAVGEGRDILRHCECLGLVNLSLL